MTEKPKYRLHVMISPRGKKTWCVEKIEIIDGKYYFGRSTPFYWTAKAAVDAAKIDCFPQGLAWGDNAELGGW